MIHPIGKNPHAIFVALELLFIFEMKDTLWSKETDIYFSNFNYNNPPYSRRFQHVRKNPSKFYHYK